MIENQKYGLLLQPSAKLHRQYFREMVKLNGIYVLYRSPLEGKHYTTYAEIDSNYAKPKLIGCLFDQHPNQFTTKKLGWIHELTDQESVIHVDYDLENLQVGSLFIVPSGIDDGVGRLFKVTRMSNIMVYPASIACAIVPEYEDTISQESVQDYAETSLNLLRDEEDRVLIGDDSNFY